MARDRFRLSSKHFVVVALSLLLGAAGCSSEDAAGAGGAGSASSSDTTTTTSTAATTGVGGAGGAGSGGAGGGTVESLDDILAALRADRDGTLLAKSAEGGWPLPLAEGHLFVSTFPELTKVAGDHDAWAGTAMNPDQGFSWIVLQVPPNEHYKLTDGATYAADPWSRSYTYDEFGEMSLVGPTDAHLDRWFGLGDAANEPRTVRVWVPTEAPTHVLYVHDGQNLFDPEAFWGGWHLQDSAPPAMLLVGIDNTAARMDEYTHVEDVLSGQTLGGAADAYADYLENVVRPLVATRYGEPARVGTMGSSLGGLVSLHIADRYPGEYDFAASLSGTLGWGSIGANNETMIERYAAHGHQGTELYVDSGGFGDCFDGDGDGIEDDDPNAGDNYCENVQFADVLRGVGYADNVDLFYYWEPNAEHNEAEWAARVFRPLDLFADL